MTQHTVAVRWGRTREFALAVTALGLAVATCAALAPFDRWFAPNFGFYLGTLALMLVPLLIQRPRPALVTGVSLVLTLCLIGFASWNHESLGWLLYVFCMPGAAIAAGAVGLARRYWQSCTAGFAATCAAAVTLAAMLVNVLIMNACL